MEPVLKVHILLLASIEAQELPEICKLCLSIIISWEMAVLLGAPALVSISPDQIPVTVGSHRKPF